MNDRFDFMGQIRHISGYMFVVLFDIDENYLIAHPKYNLQNGIHRVSNPVDPNRNNRLEIDDVVRFGEKDYLVRKCDIVEYYPCYGICDTLSIGTNESQKTRAAMRNLVNLFSGVIPKENIGVTGSLATGHASDGYSDMDVLLKESDFRKLTNSKIFSNPDIRLRNKNQWVEFYKHYGVFSALNAEEFAEAALNKLQQFFYQGIPVSLFIDSEDDFLQITDSFSTNNYNSMVVLKGRVVSEKMVKLPGYILMKCDGRIVVVINLHRTYQNCLYVGDCCEVKARTSTFSDLYIVHYDNECYIKRKNGDINNDK